MDCTFCRLKKVLGMETDSNIKTAAIITIKVIFLEFFIAKYFPPISILN